MTIDKEIIDFTNMLIAKAKTNEDLTKSINTYKEYLVLTGICDDEVLNFIGNVKSKSNMIFELKKQFGSFDVRGILSGEYISGEERTIATRVLEKHYHHYVSDSNSSGCGSSYSSSCGGGTTVYRGC